MENIRGIRRLYRRGNGQGNDYRARLNSWSFYELQRQIEYKARWEGIPVAYVAARGTSVNCSICGSRTYPNGQRTLHCSRCGISVDRDVNAARNILAKGGGVRFTPDGPPEVRREAVKGNEATTAPILRADGGKVTQAYYLEVLSEPTSLLRAAASMGAPSPPQDQAPDRPRR
jgi:putative transposase